MFNTFAQKNIDEKDDKAVVRLLPRSFAQKNVDSKDGEAAAHLLPRSKPAVSLDFAGECPVCDGSDARRQNPLILAASAGSANKAVR
jgi:hypothetical protein